MSSEYAHLPIGEPFEFVSASYWVLAEDKIPYNGNEVLCIIRQTSSISCCGGDSACGFTSILIPGFIKKYKYAKREDGLFVSEVEPIEDQKAMHEIKDIVLKKYPSVQVEFFCP